MYIHLPTSSEVQTYHVSEAEPFTQVCRILLLQVRERFPRCSLKSAASGCAPNSVLASNELLSMPSSGLALLQPPKSVQFEHTSHAIARGHSSS